MDNMLTHYGIKGMKWGVRRYQNKDGSLTALGDRRLRRDRLDNNSPNREANPAKWDREDTARRRKLVDESRGLVRELETANNKSLKKQPRNTLDLSEMTDKELRDQINRALLEKQYNDVFNPPTVSAGRQFANDILENSGTVLAITSSALGIALAIKELME